MKRLFYLVLASFLVLAACGQEEGKSEDKKETKISDKGSKKDEVQKAEEATNTNSNNQQGADHNNISAQEAEQIVSNYYINRGSNGLQAFEFKTNVDRSNANEYYVEHLVRDAAGTPVKFCYTEYH